MKNRKKWNMLIVSLLFILPVCSGLKSSRALANVKGQADVLSLPRIRHTDAGMVIYSKNSAKIMIADVDQTNRILRLKLQNNSDQALCFGKDFQAAGNNIGKKAEADTGVLVEPGTSADLEIDFAGIAALADPQVNVKQFGENGKFADEVQISLDDVYTQEESAGETVKYVAGLLEDNENLSENMSRLEQQVSENEAEMAQMAEEISGKTESLAQQEAENSSLRGQLEEKKTENSTLAAELETKKKEGEELQTQLGAKTAEAEELETQLGAKTAEAEELETQLGAKTAEAEKLETQLGAKTAEVEELETLLEAKTAEAEGLETQLGAKTAEAEELETQLTASTAEGEALQVQLGEKIAENESLSSDLAGKTADNESLSAELAQAKAELEQLQSQLSQMEEENGRIRLEMDPGMMNNPGDLITDISIEYHDWASVKAIQLTLNNAGFDCGPVDCMYGPKTERGILEYQKARGLTENGIITEELVESLKKEGLMTDTILNHTQKDDYYTYLCYDQISYGSDNLVGTRIAVSGKILQNTKAEEGHAGYLRLAVKGENKDVLFVTYHDDAAAADLGEGAEITVYGRCVGYYDYQSRTDAEVSIPWMSADNIEPSAGE